MNNDNDVYNEIEGVLSKLKLEELKTHAIQIFPERCWSDICTSVESAREELKPKNVASAIVAVIKKSKLSGNALRTRLDTLKLKACSLSTTKIWFAYKLSEKSLDHANVPFREISTCVEQHVNSPVIAARAGNDSSILLGIKRGRRLITVYIIRNYLFVCPRINNLQILESVGKALGWKSFSDCHLSGKHIPSLMRILAQKNGATHLNGVLAKPAYKPMPRRTPIGLNFAVTEPMKKYLKQLRGDENDPSLQQLTLHTKAPFKKGHYIYSTAVLGGSNVENSLRDMAAANIISPSSLFFSMINEHCKNELKVKIE